MELKKRFNIWMLVCMLLVTVLTGCGKDSENVDLYSPIFQTSHRNRNSWH